ncbi:MipA/OmpV family protein [Roseateles puraquae]|uniref:MipA/OmpV family protein n=1 Tax=Roseateles puraquae TaxID=431059 RepID=UPI0031D4F569
MTVALGTLAAEAHAAGSLLLLDAPPADVTWSAGLSARGWPRAPGSSRQREMLLPALDYESPSGVFAATDSGLGWNLSPRLLDAESAKVWQFGGRLWPESGRSRHASPPGVERLGSRIVTELFANAQVLPELLIQSGLSWGSGRHHNGDQLEIGATSGIPIGENVLGITVAASYANAAHQRGSFGIGARESLASGLPVFKAHSGWQDWSIGLSAEHKLSESWSVNGQWLHARLIDQPAHSPLTKSADQPSFIVSIWRKF